MRKPTIVTIILALTLLQAIARESNIQEGEEGGIPKRADVHKKMNGQEKPVPEREKREVKQNQEDTDPVFYDSTTSPKEMEQKKDEEF